VTIAEAAGESLQACFLHLDLFDGLARFRSQS
jgi:hypothetical protein